MDLGRDRKYKAHKALLEMAIDRFPNEALPVVLEKMFLLCAY